MNDDRSRPRHPIQVAARRAGLNPALLRAWERRYGAVDPWRNESQQRLYSDDDVERLRRLRMATEVGRRISDVAALDDERLAALVREDTASGITTAPSVIAGRPSLDDLLERCMACVQDRDDDGVRRELERAVLLYDPLRFLDDVLGVLLERVDDARARRTIDAYHARAIHFTVRSFLDDLGERLVPHAPRARLAVTVPSGDGEEIGSWALAVASSVCGCQSLRLDPSLPLTTIARIAREHEVDAVAVSIAHADAPRRIEKDLVALRRSLDPQVQLLVGGRASRKIRGVVEEIGALACLRLQDLPETLDRLFERPFHGTESGAEGSDAIDDRSIAS